ncbi:uncharacterized protein LOC142219242 [Leptodactylus fuscus]|uniref:uncharacterized protein LOC142219242 n=1 Tax=Leptodactylus fuscus TaxID=238119 RepID=UPI003F4E499D
MTKGKKRRLFSYEAPAGEGHVTSLVAVTSPEQLHPKHGHDDCCALMSRSPGLVSESVMENVACKQDPDGDPRQGLAGNSPRKVKVEEEEEVICVKIKEEEVGADISPDLADTILIYRDLDDEGADTSMNMWEEEVSVTSVPEKWRPTRWGTRMPKVFRDSDSESAHLGPEPYESSSEEAEFSQPGLSQLPSIARPAMSPRHDTGRGSERGSKRSRKRRREEAEIMESVLHRLSEMNEERTRHLKEMMSQQEMFMRQMRDDDDSDMLFLKSLLPLMREMPSSKKMECWKAMMDVMARFMAPSCAAHSGSQPPFPHVPPPEPWHGQSGYMAAPSTSRHSHSHRRIAEREEYQHYPA